MKAFYRLMFRVFGWQMVGKKPDLKKFVLVVAPHTSNWDFFVGLAARSLSDLKSNFLMKKSLFDLPLVGWFMRKVGGFPVDRGKRNSNLVHQVVDYFEQKEAFVLTITPEGTRAYNPKWKTGFYHIANLAKVPIVMVAFDFKKKTVFWEKPFYPTGDMEKDIEKIKAYYRGITGRHPEKGVR